MYKIISILILTKLVKSLPFDVTTKQVVLGSSVTLKCFSNDENYNFLLWQPADPLSGLIGPSNNYSTTKYNYEILSGKLIINQVSLDDDGIYNCISKGVRNEKINISAIKLVVMDGFSKFKTVGYYICHLIFFLGMTILILQIIYIVYYKWFKVEKTSNNLDYLECINDEEDFMANLDLSTNQGLEIMKEEGCIKDENEK